jgi:hypothetical protein
VLKGCGVVYLKYGERMAISPLITGNLMLRLFLKTNRKQLIRRPEKLLSLRG